MTNEAAVNDALNRLDSAVNTVKVGVDAGDVAVALTHVERLRERVKELETEREERVGTLAKERVMMRGRIATLERQLSERAPVGSFLDVLAERDASRARVKNLEAQLASRDVRISGLEAAVNVMRAEIAWAQQALTARGDTIEELRAIIDRE